LIRRFAFYALALVFTLLRVFPVQKNKAVLLRHFAVWGSLEALGEAMEHVGLRVVYIANWKRPSTLYHLATAGAVFVNNNFSLLAYLPFSRKTKLVQLWHGGGALKRWGFSLDENRGNRVIPYDAVICGCEALRTCWAEAFGLPVERILPLGSPAADSLVQPYDAQALRAAFDAKYPQCAGKRFILYAPTFREEPSQNAALLSRFDFGAFEARFGGEAALPLRLHPEMHGAYVPPACAVDVTGEADPVALLRVCERLVTDYSSLMLDAAALDIPVVIYAFDYDDYMTAGPGFYTDLREVPPGPVIGDFGELLGILARPDNSSAQRKAFAQFHMGKPDGKSCERIIGEFFP